MMRDLLFSSPSPGNVLYSLPPLDSELILTIAVHLIAELPEDLYERMKWHALDDGAAK